uniref:Uncharacterized protein n=1 Tax=Sphaerodactylus townsendi TaxID=933632 RepID=A0ACB8FLW5_9SAUR
MAAGKSPLEVAEVNGPAPKQKADPGQANTKSHCTGYWVTGEAQLIKSQSPAKCSSSASGEAPGLDGALARHQTTSWGSTPNAAGSGPVRPNP